MTETLRDDFERRKATLDKRASELTGHSQPVFRDVTLRTPSFRDHQFGFVQTVSWLYVHYVEAGRPGLAFLLKLFPAYELDLNRAERHQGLIQALRTSLQHNLNLTRDHDRQIEDLCTNWYRGVCDGRAPSADEDWLVCTSTLLLEAIWMMDQALQCTEFIANDPDAASIVGQWMRAVGRHHDAWEFDDVISETARDLGHGQLAVVKFRQRHHEAWRAAMDFYDDGFDFQYEARRLVERSMLSDWTGLLPITGRDIIETFAIPPGPKVGELLRVAEAAYQASPCSREALLELVRSQIGPEN